MTFLRPFPCPKKFSTIDWPHRNMRERNSIRGLETEKENLNN